MSSYKLINSFSSVPNYIIYITKGKPSEMKKEFEIAMITRKGTSESDKLYQRHLKEGIPYVELRRGKKYGEIWFETPYEIPFHPKTVFELKEWYESYWLKRREYKGLHPYRFSLGPTAIWFKFTLTDLDSVREQLLKLAWVNISCSMKNLLEIKSSSDRIFWDYAECYFTKSKSMRRKRGQKVDMSEWNVSRDQD